ncbi:MAG: DivIVA domain-containing protein [Propionibacteriaceae bacterium]|nr:DivIVA domain-containing protein [Propionibacteriaceae bacterium]
MVWLIVVAAMVILGVAAVAGTGRFGEMPEVVNDRPKPVFPDLPFGPEYLARLRLPRVSTGYDPGQVDDFLAAVAAGQHRQEPMLDVVAGGYDMQATDQVIAEAMRELEEQRVSATHVESPDVSAEQPTEALETQATPRRGASTPEDAE